MRAGAAKGVEPMPTCRTNSSARPCLRGRPSRPRGRRRTVIHFAEARGRVQSDPPQNPQAGTVAAQGFLAAAVVVVALVVVVVVAAAGAAVAVMVVVGGNRHGARAVAKRWSNRG